MDYQAAVWLGLGVIVVLLLVVLAACTNALLRKVRELAKASRRGESVDRLIAFYNNGYIAAHVRALASGDAGVPLISHAMSHASRTILPREGRRGSAVMCTIAVGDGYLQSVAPCIESQRLYAERHGFDYLLVAEKPPRFERPIPWMKIALIARLLGDGYQRIFFMDGDAMITDGAVSVESYFETLKRTGKSILLTEDGRGVNTGVMFVNNGPAALRLMDMVWSYDVEVNHSTWEQHAMNVLLNTYPEFRAQLEIDPVSRHFNSFPIERRQVIPTADDQIWAKGDFVCHLAGMRNPQLSIVARHYAKITGAASADGPG